MFDNSTKHQDIYPPPLSHLIKLIIKKESMPVLYISGQVDKVGIEGGMIVRLPEDRNDLPISDGDALIVEYPLNDALYEAICIVDKIESEFIIDEPYTLIFLDSTSNLKRVQRRGMYRFPVTLPLNYYKENENSSLCSGEIINISGTGLSMAAETCLNAGDEIIVYLLLYDVHLTLNARVIWSESLENGRDLSNKIGLHFEKIPTKEQNQVCKFIFKEQRHQIHEKIA